MKNTLLIIFTFSALLSRAQDETVKKLQTDANKNITKQEDTLHKTWRKGGLLNLNVSQGSLSNWAAGGDNFSLAVNSLVSLFAFYKNDKHNWDNTLDVNYSYINTSTLGARKNDDRFDLLSKYGFSLNPKLSLTALLNFRTQMFRGYTYADTTRTFSSTFLSPAYTLFSLGIDYKPTGHLSIFASPVTSRWVLVKNDSLATHGLYGVAAGHHSAFEFGAFVTINYLKDFNKVVSYKGRLDLFSNYRHNPQNIDVNMTNLFSVKLSRILSATWNVDLIYDDDVRLFGKNKNSPAWQIKSLVGIGLLFRFGKA